jgi:UDP-glucose 4-epimerase
MTAARSVLITGAGGYLGRQLVASLAGNRGGLETVVAADLHLPSDQLAGIEYEAFDIRDAVLSEILERNRVDTVVHLAAVVSAGKSPDRELEHSIDVGGTRNVLESSLAAGVGKVIISSSGAAYGYHDDNPEWLTEDHAIRGNPEFAYSDHKRQIEEMLAVWRKEHPELRQLIFRPGTILGATTRNQITDLFDRRLIIGLREASTPFVFIWDNDVVAILRRGILTDRTGIYNVAGDGVMTMADIAARLGKRYVNLPVWLVRGALKALRAVKLTQYGPEQVDFLRYRPVLDNRRLKDQFGYTPQKTTRETFEAFVAGRQGDKDA